MGRLGANRTLALRYDRVSELCRPKRSRTVDTEAASASVAGYRFSTEHDSFLDIPLCAGNGETHRRRGAVIAVN